jgi:acetyl/propionyl-CoA carboxylase alpha subunit
MEMNTRLQVEHPVTEAITGLDLVEWQLRVAAGEPLPLAQADIPLQGAAVEARLYAENPATGFLPSTGRLERLRLPGGAVRVDSGVEEGGEVTPFYDPMIAKLIAHGPTREAAAARLAEACRSVEVWPVRTNAGFLARCLAHPDFVAGEVDTGFIERHAEALLDSQDAFVTALLAAAKARVEPAPGDISPWSRLIGFRLNASPQLRASFQVGDEVKSVVAGGYWENGQEPPVQRFGDRLVVFVDGETFEFADPQASSAEEAASSDGAIRSPMPGKIVAVQAKAGARVAKGAPLVTLEAMKMEHALAAPFDAVVTEAPVSPGDQVVEGALLVRLDRAP